jgi:hypothetical protein
VLQRVLLAIIPCEASSFVQSISRQLIASEASLKRKKLSSIINRLQVVMENYGNESRRSPCGDKLCFIKLSPSAINSSIEVVMTQNFIAHRRILRATATAKSTRAAQNGNRNRVLINHQSSESLNCNKVKLKLGNFADRSNSRQRSRQSKSKSFQFFSMISLGWMANFCLLPLLVQKVGGGRDDHQTV